MPKEHHKRIQSKRFIYTLVALLLFPLTSSWAQESLTLEARAGFDGAYKIDSWVPIELLITNQGAEVRGELELWPSDATSAEAPYVQPAELPGQARKRFTFFVYLDTYVQKVQVRLVNEDRVLAQKEVTLSPQPVDTFFLGVVSDDPTGLSYLAGLSPSSGRRVQLVYLPLSTLPTQGRILESIDALALHNVDTMALSEGQLTALRGWVALGGHLIVCGGPSTLLTTAGLGDLLPIQVAGTRTTKDVDALGDLVQIPLLAGVPAVVAELMIRPSRDNEILTASILCGERDLPLVVRQSVGSGWVDVLAIDPGLEPFRTWMGIEDTWIWLLFEIAPAQAAWIPDLSSSWNGTYDALSNIRGLDAPPALLVIAFLGTYVVLVGPLNFLVLKVVDRRELAWITVPGMILVFASIAYTAGLSIRGRRVVVSQVSVIQASPQSKMAAVDGLVGVYSPHRAVYDIRLPDHTLSRPSAGPHLGARWVGPIENLRVEPGPPTRIRNLHVDVGTMSDFVIGDLIPWSMIESHISLTRVTPVTTGASTAYRVQGQLSNLAGEPIDHPALVLGSTVTPLPTLQPGATESFDFQVQVGSPKELHMLLDALVETAGPQGPDRREIARRRSILEGFAGVQLYHSASQIPFHGLTLIGWMETSPLAARVEGVHSRTEATTLVVAPLTIDTAQDGQVLLPRGFASWQRTAGDREATPHQIYAYQSPPTFRFMLISPQVRVPKKDSRVEHLIVHLYTPTPSPHAPPVISIKRADGNGWETLSGLDWGANVIPAPERFVDPLGMLGVLDISVETKSISDQPVSIDIEVISQEG